MAGRKLDAMATVFAYVVVALIFIAICVVGLGIRLAITGGDIGCVFSPDPALCVTVKGLGR